MMGGEELPCVGLKEDESQAFCPLIHPHTHPNVGVKTPGSEPVGLKLRTRLSLSSTASTCTVSTHKLSLSLHL